MKATKQKNYQRQENEKEFCYPENVQDLFEVADRLWFEYFTPAQPYDSKTKSKILATYNEAVKRHNKIQGFNRLMSLTSSTYWKPQADETGPDMKEKIFVDIIEFKPEVSKPAKVVRMSQAPTPGSKPAHQFKRGSIIEQILELHKQGKTNKEIVAAGFNKSTVNRQVSEYKKRIANEKK